MSMINEVKLIKVNGKQLAALKSIAAACRKDPCGLAEDIREIINLDDGSVKEPLTDDPYRALTARGKERIMADLIDNVGEKLAAEIMGKYMERGAI